MIRIARVAAIALVGISLTACSAVPQRDVAATVGDATLTQDELNDVLTSELGRQLLSIPLDASRFSTEAVTQVLNTWITVNAVPDGALPSPEGIDDDLAQQYGEVWAQSPRALRDLLVRVNQLNAAFQSGDIGDQQLLDFIDEGDPSVWSRLGVWQGPELGVQPLGR